MLGYFDCFPEKTRTELRTATFGGMNPEDPIPPGKYLFTEYFCTDPTCDCQRVLVKVLRVESDGRRPEDVATISYTWNEDPDDTWSFVTADLPNPFLDPCHRRTRYAQALLEFWSTMLEHDTAYAERLKRHCAELRSACCHRERPSRTSRKGAPKLTLTKADRKARQRRLASWNRVRKSR